MILLFFLIFIICHVSSLKVVTDCVCNPTRSVSLKHTNQNVILKLGDSNTPVENAGLQCESACNSTVGCNIYATIYNYANNFDDINYGCLLYEYCTMSYYHEASGLSRIYQSPKNTHFTFTISENSRCVFKTKV